MAIAPPTAVTVRNFLRSVPPEFIIVPQRLEPLPTMFVAPLANDACCQFVTLKKLEVTALQPAAVSN